MAKPITISALEDHVGYWLRFVSNHVSHAFKRKLEEHGVTVAEWVILRELFRLEGTAPNQLATNLGLTRGAISKLIERLVKKELVDRVASEKDRRYQRVTLTAAGYLLVPQLAALADQNDAEFFGHLAQTHRKSLIQLMREIVRLHQLKDVPID
jgi:MarR family transcriptional regulator, lower aerobic nicotinate degradation pathway regulator